jgi:hypothetical protein
MVGHSNGSNQTQKIRYPRKHTGNALEYGEVAINIPDKKYILVRVTQMILAILLIDGNAVGGGGVSSFNTRTGACIFKLL